MEVVAPVEYDSLTEINEVGAKLFETMSFSQLPDAEKRPAPVTSNNYFPGQQDTGGELEDTTDEELDALPPSALQCQVFEREYSRQRRRELWITVRGASILTIILALMLGVIVWFVAARYPTLLLVIWSVLTGIIGIISVGAWVWVGVKLQQKKRLQTSG